MAPLILFMKFNERNGNGSSGYNINNAKVMKGIEDSDSSNAKYSCSVHGSSHPNETVEICHYGVFIVL